MLPHGSGFSSPWTMQEGPQKKQVLEMGSVIPARFCVPFKEESRLGYLPPAQREDAQGLSSSSSRPVWGHQHLWGDLGMDPAPELSHITPAALP